MRRSRRILFAIVGVVLATAGGALAAWLIYSGVSGSATGKVGSPSTVDALTISAVTPTGTVIPGTPETLSGDVVNNASVPETVTSLTASSITASPTCNTSALSYTPGGGVMTPNLPTGDNGVLGVGTLTAASNLDTNCAGATITISLTGTTSP